jgi:hypothetical protein
MATKKSGVKNGTVVEKSKRPRGGQGLHNGSQRSAGGRGDNLDQQLDDIGGRQRPGGGQQRDRRRESGDLAVGRDAECALPADEHNHDVGGQDAGVERLPKSQGEIALHRHAKKSIDRLDEILKVPGEWNIRVLNSVLLEEDFGYGNFLKHRDLRVVGDLLRVGNAGLKMRFREVDPLTWDWLFEKLEEVR